MNVENVKVITLNYNLPQDYENGALVTDITTLSFVPDECYVRSVVFKNNGLGNVPAALLWLDAPNVGPITLATFLDGSAYAPQTRFLIGARVNGQYSFQTKTIVAVGGLNEWLQAQLTGNLVIQLEFVRYKRPAASGRDDDSITVYTPSKDRLGKLAAVRTG